MKIYSPPDNHILAKILFTAQISKTRLAHQPVPYGYKHKQFQQQNALFTIPALQLQPHHYIFGPHAILRTLAPNQHNLSVFQEVNFYAIQAQVNQWLQQIQRQFEPAVGVLILNINQLTEVKEEQITKAKETVLRVAKQLDQRLKMSTFLVGNSLTIADISAYFSWNEVRPHLQKESKGLNNLNRWAKYFSSIPTH